MANNEFTQKNENRKQFHEGGKGSHIRARALRREVDGAFGNLPKSEGEALAIGTSKEGKF